MEHIIKSVDPTCEACLGTGEVQVDVFDPDSGQYMRGVGTEKCECTIPTEEDEAEYDRTDWNDPASPMHY